MDSDDPIPLATLAPAEPVPEEPPPEGSPERRCRTPFGLWVLAYVLVLFGIPLAGLGALARALPDSRLAELGFLLAAPLLYAVAFGLLAGVLSLPSHRHVIAGSFPRDLRIPVYRGRRLYGLCWTAVYYFTPVYWMFLSLPPLKAALFRLFGYRGSMDFTVYPDTWIRDLPLLTFGKGAYVSNKATLGTNVCLNDGTILVDRITVGPGAMVGHLAMLAPGVVMEERSEIGIGTAIGIKARLGPRVSVGGLCTVSHLSRLEEGVSTGTAVDIGAAVHLGKGIHIRPGSFVPNRTRWKTQGDADVALDAQPSSGSAAGTSVEPNGVRASAARRRGSEDGPGRGSSSEMRSQWNHFE